MDVPPPPDGQVKAVLTGRLVDVQRLARLRSGERLGAW
jgi:hypothetical protein